MTDKNSIEVTKWLKENDAATYVDKFYSEGFYSLADLSKEAIEKIVQEQGLRNRLIRVLAQQSTVPPVPHLPPGTTLDLSVRNHTSPEGIEFSLPQSLSFKTGSGEVIAPDQLTPQDWVFLASRSKMLYGFKAGSPQENARALHPVLYWRVPERSDFMIPEHLERVITSELTYTETTSSWAKAGFQRVAGSGTYMFCSASFEVALQERRAQSRYRKKLCMTGQWSFPRVTVLLDECTTVSKEFVKEVEAAISSQANSVKPSDPGNRTDPLIDVFDKYGHFIPKRVQLGGMLYFQKIREMTGSIDERTWEQNVKAAVSVKLGSIAGGSQSGGADTKVAQEIAENVQFVALGGDVLQTDPGQWASSVRNPDLWRVIKSEDLQPTVDLLPEDLRKKITERWKAVSPQGYPPPSMDDRVFFIRTSPLNLPGESLGAISGKGNDLASTTKESDIRQKYWWHIKFSGQFDQFDSAPLFFIEYAFSDYTLTAEPAGTVLARLNHPIFPLSQSLSPSFQNELRREVASLVPFREEMIQHPLTQGRTSLWRITPMDGPDGYMIQNFATRNYLCKQSGFRPSWVGLATRAPELEESKEFLNDCEWYLIKFDGPYPL